MQLLFRPLAPPDRPCRGSLRLSALRWVTLWIVAVLAALVTVPAVPAEAAMPLDHRSTAPNHPSELPGSGYLLTDPAQGGSRAYWAGAYRTIHGVKSYCIDDFYDYPNASYGYRAPEVSRWAGRPGSNAGASGVTAQRIIWIINSYGQSASPATTAAVSMAINLLSGSTPFLRSYHAYFRPQLLALDSTIVPRIERFIRDSAWFAGPYTTRVTFGPAPAVGGQGVFAVSVRSGRGVSIRNAAFRVTALNGAKLVSAASGSTGATGVRRLTYTALRAGTISASARGTSEPNTTMRLGYSPTHNTNNFATGSQRVALVSAERLKATSTGSGHVVVAPATVRTSVITGTGPRVVGALVRDRIDAEGLIPRADYTVTATLQDASGVRCATAAVSAQAGFDGTLRVSTPPMGVCGAGTNTFVEKVSDSQRRIVASTPPGQPAETFPVTPVVTTAVRAGNGNRTVGTPVVDRITALGLLPSTGYLVTASLTAEGGRACGTVSAPVSTDTHGRFTLDSGPVPACGLEHDTFTERVTTAAGVVVATTPPGQPAETFPVTAPPIVVSHPPIATAPVPTSPPSPSPVRSPAHSRPVGAPSAPTGYSGTPVRQAAVTAAPQLALTGARPTALILTGLIGVAGGALVLLLTMLRPRR